MSGKTVSSAILLLVIGNALALISDVFIKLLEPGAPVFQFAFLRCALTLLFLLPLWKQINHRKLFEGGRAHFVRAHIHLGGILCMIVALGALPLATANAIFYAAPVLVMVLSVLVFREQLTTLSVVAVISGFLGIIVILRPMAFNWGAIAALGSAGGACDAHGLPRVEAAVDLGEGSVALADERGEGLPVGVMLRVVGGGFAGGFDAAERWDVARLWRCVRGDALLEFADLALELELIDP